MNVILKISLRNLVRQKRRNLLLGMGIAFGMCILVMANALGTGISDLLLNKMGGRVFGHVFVSMSEKDEKKWDIIRDKERIKQVILDARQRPVERGVAFRGFDAGNTNGGIALINRAIGCDPQVVFQPPFTAAKRSGALVSGFCVDLVQYDHGCFLSKYVLPVLTCSEKEQCSDHGNDSHKLGDHAPAHQGL